MIKITGKDGNKYELIKHKLGFLQVSPIPKLSELNSYYAKKYYQNPQVASYALSYSVDELQLQSEVCKMTNQLFEFQFPNANKSLYDIGCGEGFFMQGLLDCGWTVYGVDYSVAGIEKHNPGVAPYVNIGDGITDIEACKKNIEQLKDDQKTTTERLSILSETGINGNDLLRYTEYISALDIETDIRKTELRILMSKLFKKKKELKKKSIDKKVIENLKDLKKEEFDLRQ